MNKYALALGFLFTCAVALGKFTTQPATTTASATPTTHPAATQPVATVNFPTPAELIEKMRTTRKAKEALPHVAYFDLNEPIVEKPADFSFFGDADATTLRSLLDRIRKAKTDKEIRGVLITLGANSELNLAQAMELRDTLRETSKSGKQTFVYA